MTVMAVFSWDMYTTVFASGSGSGSGDPLEDEEGGFCAAITIQRLYYCNTGLIPGNEAAISVGGDPNDTTPPEGLDIYQTNNPCEFSFLDAWMDLLGEKFPFGMIDIQNVNWPTWTGECIAVEILGTPRCTYTPAMMVQGVKPVVLIKDIKAAITNL